MSAPDETADLTVIAGELLEGARTSTDHRASRLVVHGQHQRVLAMALLAGAVLAEHEAPRAATLQTLRGRVRLHAGETEWVLADGQLAAIPQQRHGVEALEDSVVLLTVTLD